MCAYRENIRQNVGMRNHSLIYILIGLIFVVWVYVFFTRGGVPEIVTAHVINLDRDAGRWKSIQKTAVSAAIPIERWAATYGADLTNEDIYAAGVGSVIFAKGQGVYTEQFKERRNLGAIGCFVSHKRLMQHLAEMPVPDSAGHLILEDDIALPANFLSPGDEWHAIKSQIPADWDIIYLGLNSPIGDAIHTRVMRPRITKGYNTGNWGTHAYIVRHGALHGKILPGLEWMTDAIDTMFSQNYEKWNVYAVQPNLVRLNAEESQKSTIQTM